MTFSVPDFGSSRVLVAGDVMLDRYWLGPTSRISPEAPVPVVNITGSEDRAGGAANVAMNLNALGTTASLCGVVGEDEEAGVLADLLNEAGVLNLLQSGAPRTITKLRVLSRNQQLIRLDKEEDASTLARVSLKANFVKGLKQADVVILSDYAKGALHNPQDFIQAARAASKPVLVDPKGADFSRYRGATLLTPNLGEFEAVVGRCQSTSEIEERAQALCKEFDLEALLVTRSAEGMSLITPSGATHFAAAAREVYDVTGAGDTVIATLAGSLATGASLSDSVALANLAASIVVGKLGVATVSQSELRQALHRRGTGGRSVLPSEQLLEAVIEAKERGERIVFTNGCFDLLHAGHVAYLEEAKALGGRLIVAVNDDDSVTRLKGEARPINSLADRQAVLSGLAAVDWVTSFSDDTPRALIEKLTPDVLVKGGDYTVDEIVGGDWVTSHGGRVEVLTFKEGRSTTDLIAAIKRL
ncbi:MAG: bifunctional D-glycero-beta-D-manno-heptose-7-phosphate kinase/D-glycero-beta-D-manno-heptose 1-phosphate adenylyltransferase HldE [Gammaproteobacteria bacterium]